MVRFIHLVLAGIVLHGQIGIAAEDELESAALSDSTCIRGSDGFPRPKGSWICGKRPPSLPMNGEHPYEAIFKNREKLRDWISCEKHNAKVQIACYGDEMVNMLRDKVAKGLSTIDERNASLAILENIVQQAVLATDKYIEELGEINAEYDDYIKSFQNYLAIKRSTVETFKDLARKVNECDLIELRQIEWDVYGTYDTEAVLAWRFIEDAERIKARYYRVETNYRIAVSIIGIPAEVGFKILEDAPDVMVKNLSKASSYAGRRQIHFKETSNDLLRRVSRRESALIGIEVRKQTRQSSFDQKHNAASARFLGVISDLRWNVYHLHDSKPGKPQLLSAKYTDATRFLSYQGVCKGEIKDWMVAGCMIWKENAIQIKRLVDREIVETARRTMKIVERRVGEDLKIHASEFHRLSALGRVREALMEYDLVLAGKERGEL